MIDPILAHPDVEALEWLPPGLQLITPTGGRWRSTGSDAFTERVEILAERGYSMDSGDGATASWCASFRTEDRALMPAGATARGPAGFGVPINAAEGCALIARQALKLSAAGVFTCQAHDSGDGSALVAFYLDTASQSPRYEEGWALAAARVYPDGRVEKLKNPNNAAKRALRDLEEAGG